MSVLTLKNETPYIAQFLVTRGDQVIARLPGLLAQQVMQVPTTATYEVVASTLLDSNTYTSAPMVIDGATGFLAQVLQVYSQGSYQFNVLEQPSTVSNQLQFQKTCLNPVTFTIRKDGAALQTVVVSDSFTMQTLTIGDNYSIHAVINGITTETVTTSDAGATVSAVVDTSEADVGYFRLLIS
jgi:hypothetical protein